MPKRKSTEELRRYKKKPRRKLNYLTRNIMSDYIMYYAIIAGISIIVYWINYLRKSKLNNTYIKTHIIAEITTAVILIYSVFSKSTVLIPLSFGMLLYATINIIGEYIDKKEVKMVGILIINIIILIFLMNFL